MAKCIAFYYSMFFHILSAEFSRIKRRVAAAQPHRCMQQMSAYNGDPTLRQPRAVIFFLNHELVS